MYLSDDPVRDFERYDHEQTENNRKHYKCNCAQCGETVYDYEDYYDFYGDVVHDDCILDFVAQFKK